ncbi:MAG: glycosyltransferase [Candidatus Gracilibacteria bacterium]|nr:glycosyltransferase [Candidatus Gracilibacteria bacterium]
MKIALAHDFLTYLGGAERVLKVLSDIFPAAPIYTLLYDEEKMGQYFPKERVRSSNLQHSIFKNRKQFLLSKFPIAVEQFDFSDYDLVISSSGAWMKGILTKPETRHICYCHGPMRFAWDRQAEYLASKNIKGLKKYFVLKLLNKVRNWDKLSSDRPDLYLANSNAIKELIAKNYKPQRGPLAGLEARVLYPPVDVQRFEIHNKDQGYYLIVSRLSPYKNIELAVRAFADLPDQELIIIGTGEQQEYLKKIATSNVKLLGFKADKETKKYFENCHAFIFPGEDDFGITPVEAMACGKPVLAFGKGGALETIRDGETGTFFRENNKKSFLTALQKLEQTKFDPAKIRMRAEEFSTEVFVKKIKEIVEDNRS